MRESSSFELINSWVR